MQSGHYSLKSVIFIKSAFLQYILFMWLVSFSQQRVIIYSYKALTTWYFF